MDNVESAEAAGDEFPTTRVLTADGVTSLIGALMGNPFINAVYIGHPGWKAMGGRIGYSAATGLMVIVLAWLGVISLLLSLIPVVAIPADPALHRHAGRRAGVPDHAGQTCAGDRAGADTAPRCLGQDTGRRRADCRRYRRCDGRPRQAGRNWSAVSRLDVLGNGSILSGLVLAAISVFVIEREFVKPRRSRWLALC